MARAYDRTLAKELFVKHLATMNAIIDRLAYFAKRIEAAGPYVDANRMAQNVLPPILNAVFQKSRFRNLDAGFNGAFPGIDLADEHNRIAVQVTSTPTIEKVKETLSAFLEERPKFRRQLRTRYKRLLIYVLTERQSRYSRTSLDKLINGRMKFDPSKDIWDYKTLVSHIEPLDIVKKRYILSQLRQHIGDAFDSQMNGSILAANELLEVIPESQYQVRYVDSEEGLAEVYDLAERTFDEKMVVTLETFRARCLKYRKGTIGLYLGDILVGYVTIWPLWKTSFTKFVNGVLTEDELSDEHINNGDRRQIGFIHIGAIIVNPPRSKKVLAPRLVEGALRLIARDNKLADVIESVALPSSISGTRLLQRLGFSQCPHVTTHVDPVFIAKWRKDIFIELADDLKVRITEIDKRK